MDKNTKINETKTENGTYIIRMADFYPGYNGETEFQKKVSREVYEYLRSEKRREYREKSLDNYWRTSFRFDEDKCSVFEKSGVLYIYPRPSLPNSLRRNSAFSSSDLPL